MSYLERLDLETLKEAILTLEGLEEVSGWKARKKIIEEHKSNPVLQEFFLRTSGTEKYHVRLKEDIPTAEDAYSLVDSFKKFMLALDALRDRKVTGKEAKSRVIAFLSKCHPRLRKWYLRVLDHDLRIGVSRKSIVKVYGSGFWEGVEEDDFHFHGCCLAKDIETVITEESPLSFPVAVEFKLDGERALIFVFPEQRELKIYTRGLLRKAEIEGVDSLIDQFIAVAAKVNELRGEPTNTPLFLDGEFLATNWNDTSSVVGSTTNFNEEEFLAETKVLLFDWCPVEDYIKKEYLVPWKQRKQLLMRAAGATRIYEKVRQITDNVFVLGHRIVSNDEELEAFHQWSLDGGFEGTMVKILDAPHVFNREHKYVLKLKPTKDKTGTIKGWVAGNKQHAAASLGDKEIIWTAMVEKLGGADNDGYYFTSYVDAPEEAAEYLRTLVKDDRDRRITTHIEGAVSYRHSERLGAFIVDLDGEEVNVGGGFKYKAGQDERMDFWQRREDLIGVKIDVKLQGDKVSVAKARFNRFVRLRWDLTESQTEESA